MELMKRLLYSMKIKIRLGSESKTVLMVRQDEPTTYHFDFRRVLAYLLGLFSLPFLFYLTFAYQLVMGRFIAMGQPLTGFDTMVVSSFLILTLLIFLGLAMWLKLFQGNLSGRLGVKVLTIGLLALAANNLLGLAVLRWIDGRYLPANQFALQYLFQWVPVPFLFVMIVVAAPLLEELFFRGFLPRLLLPGQQRLGLYLGGFLFGLFHRPTNLGSAIIYIGMGLIFSETVARTNRLAYGILLHSVYNLIIFIGMLAVAG